MKPIILNSVLGSVLVSLLAGLALAEAPDGLPMDAAAGECFARIVTPDSYETVTERAIDRKASFEIRDVPAQYESVEEQVLVREGTVVYKSIPAVYKTVAQEIEIDPGLSKTVMKQVLVEPARIVEETIEPEYKTIEVQRLVQPARQERIEIPATYKQVERRVAIGGSEEWVPILCETNASPELIAEIQTALTQAGHPLAVDGKFGPQTFAAMKAYQTAHGLPVGVLTLETVERLGVTPS